MPEQIAATIGFEELAATIGLAVMIVVFAAAILHRLNRADGDSDTTNFDDRGDSW